MRDRQEDGRQACPARVRARLLIRTEFLLIEIVSMSLSVGRRIAFVLFFGDEKKFVSGHSTGEALFNHVAFSGCWRD